MFGRRGPAILAAVVVAAGAGPLVAWLGDAGGSGPHAVAASARVTAVRHVESEAGEAPRPDHPDEAVALRHLQLEDEHGAIPPNAFVDAAAQAAQMRSRPTIAPLAAGVERSQWTSLGPGNIGGRIRSIAINPSNALTMYAGSVGGGIWKTTDGGASWQPLDDFMANLAVTSLVIDPANPSVLYAATGEGFYNGDALRGAGIFKTTNAGATWTQLAATAGFQYVNKLAISPASSLILIAATRAGLYRTTDGGGTWTSLGGTDMYDVAFDPSNGTHAIATQAFGKAYYSTNSGAGWTLATGLGAYNHYGRISVAYAPSNPSIVYASYQAGAADDAHNAGQLWKSSDGGHTYSLVNTGTGYLATQGWYANAVWVDPTNASTVLVGGLDLWRSTDGGATLTQISDWRYSPTSAHADQHVIVSSPAYNGGTNRQVFFGNDGGIYKVADVLTVAQTVGWQELNNGLGITQFFGGAGNLTSGRIVAGAQDNGSLMYSGSSEGWVAAFGGDGGFVASDPTDPLVTYGEYVYLNVHRSDTGGAADSADYISGRYWHWTGAQWEVLWKGAPYTLDDARTSNALFIAPFILDPNVPSRLLAGGASLWRTNDAKAAVTDATGPSWTAIKSPLQAGNCRSTGTCVSAVAVAPGDSNIIWVGYANGAVYKTTNGTAVAPSWTQVGGATLPGRYVTRLTIDPTNSSVVYATFGGFSSDNVWRTPDGGATWVDRSGSGTTGLPDAPVRSIAILASNPSWIYAGTEIGVFASEDGGQTWSLPTDGPANVSVDELFWMGGDLVAATHGRGLFKIHVSTVAAPSITTFTPTSGPVGTSVTITGTNLTGATAVRFNGVAATTRTVNSATQITATVPAGATTGRISVVTPGGTATSAGSFTVPVSLVPTIGSFTPTSGGAGTAVTLTGTNFTGVTAVTLYDYAARYTVDSPTQITAYVPDGLPGNGRWRVTNASGTGVSSTLFTYTGPIVSTFSPLSGGAGAAVTITGANFTGATAVTLYNYPARYTVDSPTQITAYVPDGLPGNGRWRVTTAGGTGVATNVFAYTGPIVSSFAPASGGTGTSVTINGTNFTGATSVTYSYYSVQFRVVSATQITATLPDGVPATGRWRVTTPNGTGASATLFTYTGPLVSGFTPASGGAGEKVTLTGSNFTGATAVSVYFVAAQFTVDSPTQITATVPSGLPGNGRWRVTTPQGTGVSVAQFGWTGPTISGFTPTSGAVGSSVTINGANLTGATSVTFGFVAARYTVNSATQITATVPAGAPNPARWRITTPSGASAASDQFTTTSTGPSITSFTPTSGATGTLVTILGSGVNSATAVRFNGIAATFHSEDPTSVTAMVPNGATTGAISVVTGTGTATSSTAFTVTRSVTGFSPTSGPPGTVVTINGVGFTAGSTVSFSGTPAAATTFVSATQVRATSPAGASAGPISVDGATSAASFTPTTSTSTFDGAVTFNFANANPAVRENRTWFRTDTVTIGGTHYALALAPASTVYPTSVELHSAGGDTITATVAASSMTNVAVLAFRVMANGGWGPFVQLTDPAALAATPLTLTVTFTRGGVAIETKTVEYRYDADLYNAASTSPEFMGPGGRWWFDGLSARLRWQAPTVGGFTPTTGAVGTSVTITGTNLAGATAVRFNGTAAATFSVNPAGTEVVAAVPAGATTGLISVATTDGNTAGALTGTSAGTFTIPVAGTAPTVSSFAPVTGSPGVPVTITGTNFTGATAVRFNGTNAPVTVNSATQIATVVPAGATTGVVSVVAPGGTGTSAANFTVTAPAVTFAGVWTDNYKWSFNPTPGVREKRTWLHLQSVTVGGATYTVATPPPAGTIEAGLTELTLTAAGGATVVAKLPTQPANTQFKQFRRDSDGAWGPLFQLVDLSVFQTSPITLPVELWQNGALLATTTFQYRYDEAVYNAPDTSLEYMGPGGRWWVAGAASKLNWEP
jgi:hypothetical protein